MMLHVHLCDGMLSVQVSQVKSAMKVVKYNEEITINITKPFHTKESGLLQNTAVPSTVKSRFFYCLVTEKNKLTLAE